MRHSSRLSLEEREIVKRHTQEIPVKLGELARDLGLVVRVGTLEHGKSGQIVPFSDAPAGFLIRVNRHESRVRQRFTLAHEIAHYLLHRDRIGDGISDNVMYRAEGITNREEVEANQMAADLTMPAAAIQELLSSRNSSLDEDTVRDFAHRFKVSVPAMEIRLGLS